MKKGLLLIAALFVLLFVSCQKKPDTGLVNIELWYGAAITEAPSPPTDWKVLDIIREKLNINLILSSLPSSEVDQDVRINASAAAGTLPDLFMVRRDPFVNIIRSGVIAPVDSMYAMMSNRTKLHYTEESQRFTTINGESYGFASPGAIEKSEGILIRKDWLDKLGLSVPVTLQDYIDVMRAFTLRDPDGNGRNDTFGYGAFIEVNNFEQGLGRRFDPFFGAFGVAGTWNLSKENPGLNIRNPAYYDALVFIKRMVDERIIDPNWLSYKKDDFRAAWKQGRFGIMREQNAAFAAEANYDPFDQNYPNGEWIVIDPPLGATGLRSVGVYTQSYRIYAVSIRALREGKAQAIARLLEWMSSDEGYFLLGWGEEGVNYTLSENGVPTTDGIPDPSLGFTQPEGQRITQLRNMVFYNSEIELLARYPTYKARTSGKTMSALTVLREMQSKDWTPNIGGDSLPAPSGDLERFYQQGVIEFINGNRSLNKETWNAWVTEFDRRGGAAWEKQGINEAEDKGLLF